MTSRGKGADRRARKKKERARRIAWERNLRRNAARPPIEDLPEDSPDDPVHGRVFAEARPFPRFDPERMFRRIGRTLGDVALSSVEELERLTDDLTSRRIDELVAEIAPDDHEERAQELAFRAMEATPPEKAAALACEALELDPNCADALTVLAHQHPRLSDCTSALELALAAAERALGGPRYLAEHEGEFWGNVFTRPYVRTRVALAGALCHTGDLSAGAAHYRALVELCGEDPLGVRYPLVATLLQMGDAPGAREVLDRFAEDRSAQLEWARVLERFLAGDRAGAALALRRARQVNRHVARGLAGAELEIEDDGYIEGSESEAAEVVALLGSAWPRRALDWLARGGTATTRKQRRAAIVSYSGPVASLLSRGEPPFGGWREDPRLDDLTREHVPELIRMVTDPALNECPGDSREVWAPVHAWRALAHLGAVEATRPLVDLLCERFDDEWVLDDLVWVFAMLGPACMDELSRVVLDARANPDSRAAATDAIRMIGEERPVARARAVPTLVAVLERWEQEPPDLTAVVVCGLIGLDAGEAGPLIRRAYAEVPAVEEMAGRWDYVQESLGLDENGNMVEP